MRLGVFMVELSTIFYLDPQKVAAAKIATAAEATRLEAPAAASRTVTAVEVPFWPKKKPEAVVEALDFQM